MSTFRIYSLKQLLGAVVTLSLFILSGNDGFARRLVRQGETFPDIAEHLIHRDRKSNYRFYIIDKVNPEVDKPLYTPSGDMVFKFKFSAPGDAKFKYFAIQEARTAMEAYQLIMDPQVCFFLKKKVAVHTIEEGQPSLPRTILWLITIPARLCPEHSTTQTNELVRWSKKGAAELKNDEDYVRLAVPYPTAQHYTTVDPDNEEFFYAGPTSLDDGAYDTFLFKRRKHVGDEAETQLLDMIKKTIDSAKSGKAKSSSKKSKPDG